MANGTLLPTGWETPANFRERLGSKVGRQRAMFAEEHLLLVLHAPPKVDEKERTGRLFWRSPDGTWVSNAFGKGKAALSKHLDEFADVIDRLDRAEESAQSADEFFVALEALTPVHRTIHNLRSTLEEARKLVPADRDIINLRDRAYELERNADLLFDGIRHALDFAVAKRAEEQAKAGERMATSAYRLNMLAAFFFPVVTLSAVFGTNLAHGWENQHAPYLFYGMVAVGALLGVILLAVVNRRTTDT